MQGTDRTSIKAVSIMSMWNWFFDLGQESRLNKYDDKMKQLEERVEILEGWIRYYESERMQARDELVGTLSTTQDLV